MLSERPTAPVNGGKLMAIAGNATLGLPMKRWSYSIPTDQFGAKPYSMPAPTAPPQRVSLAVLNTMLGPVKKELYLLSQIQQRVVPGVADLAGEQADRVHLGLVGIGYRCRKARIRSLQVRPVALGFEAEHPVGHLPAIASLTADQSARRVVAALRDRGERNARNTVEGVTVAARGAAGIEADVETGPVVDRRHHGRLGVGRRPRRKIGRQGRRNRNGRQANRRQQQRLHPVTAPVINWCGRYSLFNQKYCFRKDTLTQELWVETFDFEKRVFGATKKP